MCCNLKLLILGLLALITTFAFGVGIAKIWQNFTHVESVNEDVEGVYVDMNYRTIRTSLSSIGTEIPLRLEKPEQSESEWIL